DPVLPKILKAAYKNSEFVSALREDDMVRLRRYIIKYFEENLVRATLEVPADDQALLSLIYKSCLILETDFSIQDRARFEVRASPAVLAKLHSHVVSVADGPFQGLRFKD
ncbi:MAG: hypothetical protein RL011_385, partial [Pseudomonadota bacterium]